MTTAPKIDREARAAAIAARRAARTTTTFGPEETIPASDLQPGDFLVTIKTAPGIIGRRWGTVIGMRCDTTVEKIEGGEVWLVADRRESPKSDWRWDVSHNPPVIVRRKVAAR